MDYTLCAFIKFKRERSGDSPDNQRGWLNQPSTSFEAVEAELHKRNHRNKNDWDLFRLCVCTNYFLCYFALLGLNCTEKTWQTFFSGLNMKLFSEAILSVTGILCFSDHVSHWERITSPSTLSKDCLLTSDCFQPKSYGGVWLPLTWTDINVGLL